MARREIKLPYTEKQIVCPHCRADLIFGTVVGKVTCMCPNCAKDFQIENDVPKKPAKSVKKSRP
jgi:hypothetical protein